MKIEGKVAVVTGGGAGIGRGLVHALSERGCRVVVADVEHDKAQAVVQEIIGQGGDAHPVACDVSDYEAVEALADAAWTHYGDVDLVFNNAGVAVTSPAGVIDGDPVDLQWVLSVNVAGVWNGCSVFGKRFVQRSSPSRIVNTASEHALGMPHAGQGFYTASKHAILGLSDVIRAELPEHVGISVFCPGLVQSELWNAARNRPQKLDATAEALLPVSKAVIEHGMPAIEVARKAVDSVERGDFLIVTHPSSRAVAELRWEEIAAAFDAQAPYAEGCERYDVNRVAESVLASLGVQA